MSRCAQMNDNVQCPNEAKNSCNECGRECCTLHQTAIQITVGLVEGEEQFLCLSCAGKTLERLSKDNIDIPGASVRLAELKAWVMNPDIAPAG